jgi:membrane protein
MIGGAIPEPVLYVLDLALAFGVLTLLFGLIFKVLPDARIDWRDAWVGAAVTAALFVVGKFAIGFYLGRGDKGDAYGAAGSLAVMLLWIYYAGMILLFGAEFTQAWAEAHGRAPQPEEGAVSTGGQEDRRTGGQEDRKTGRGGKAAIPVERRLAAPAPGKGSLLLGASLLLARMIGKNRGAR